MSRSFRFHVSNYALAELATMLAGLVSFPILTRLLSVADYGTMNLIAAALGLLVAAGKLGVQHAALRTYSEVRHGHSPYTEGQFRSTVFIGMLATSAVVALLWLVAAQALPATWWGERPVDTILWMVAALVIVRVVDSNLINQLRAEELSRALVVYAITRRYLGLVVIVGALWFLQRDLNVFFSATLAVELIAAVALMAWLQSTRPWPRLGEFSKPLYGSLVVFGLPMLGSEASAVLLAMADRYIVQTTLGAEAVGIYAASYNMCDYVRNGLLGAMAAAAYPRCMRIWEESGREGLKHFLQAYMHYYVLAAMFLVAMMSAVGGELMSVLASAKYQSGAPLMGWIMTGMALQTALSIAAIGIHLSKRTALALGLTLAGGVASVVLNLIMVPAWGIDGAAWSLVVVFAALAVAQLAYSRQTAPVVLPWRTVLRHGPFALLAWAVAGHVPLAADWQRLLAGSFAGAILYGGSLLWLDERARALVARWLPKGRTPPGSS